MAKDDDPPRRWHSALSFLFTVGIIAGAVAFSLIPDLTPGTRFAMVVVGSTVGALALLLPYAVQRWLGPGRADR